MKYVGQNEQRLKIPLKLSFLEVPLYYSEAIMNRFNKVIALISVIGLMLTLSNGCTAGPEKKSNKNYESSEKREGSGY